MTQPDAWAGLDPNDEPGDRHLSSEDQAVVHRVRSLLADPTTWSGPPPALRERLLATVRAEAAEASERNPVPAMAAPAADRASTEQAVVLAFRRSRRARWLAAGGGFVAGAAAAAAVALVVLTGPSGGGDTFELAATSRNPEAVVTALVDPQPAGVAITLNIQGLPAAPPGTYYAAWLEGEAGTVPVGTFHWRTGGVPIELWSGVTTDRYPRLFVTVQDEGGPAGPSDIIVLDGNLS